MLSLQRTVHGGAQLAGHLIFASVVVEVYNLTYAKRERATRMLAELRLQAESLCKLDDGAAVRLARPLELVIVFDPDQDGAHQIQSAFGNLAEASDALAPRFLPVSNSSYCEMKNAGAALSTGEIIIFLDSDVVPEPNWLQGYLEAFSDPGISVVVGNTYVDCQGSGAYPKAMALAWMFPLRDSNDGLTPATWFYANNVSFRREAFLSRRFQATPGLTHGPAGLLVERLRCEGVSIWHAGKARASHPPPNGPVHFMQRAVAGGRARAMCAAHAGAMTIFRWIRNDIGSIGWGCKRIVSSGSKVELRWWQVPLAVTFPVTYFALFNIGSLLTVAFPRFMRSRFDL